MAKNNQNNQKRTKNPKKGQANQKDQKKAIWPKMTNAVLEHPVLSNVG